MKIATFNTNSVRARLPIIKNWRIDEQPDIRIDTIPRTLERSSYHTFLVAEFDI